MNHIRTSIGRNRFGLNLGLNTRSKKWSSKVLYKRAFHFDTLGRPAYLIATVANPFTDRMDSGVSAGAYGVWINFKRFFDQKYVVSLSKRMWWTPFGRDTRNWILKKWKEYYEQEQVVTLPPPPVFERVLPPEMKQLTSDRKYNSPALEVYN